MSIASRSAIACMPSGFLNPKGGFYAEYAAVAADLVSRLPGKLTTEQAAVMGGVGLTALRGLDDVLGLKSGESIVIVGASGGIGHIAVQLAKRMGARVLAVASGEDGVALAKRLGADAAVDGRRGDVRAAARAFTPNAIDAAPDHRRRRDRRHRPHAAARRRPCGLSEGVEPPPNPRPGIQLDRYDGNPDADILARLNRMIEAGPFEVQSRAPSRSIKPPKPTARSANTTSANSRCGSEPQPMSRTRWRRIVLVSLPIASGIAAITTTGSPGLAQPCCSKKRSAASSCSSMSVR